MSTESLRAFDVAVMGAGVAGLTAAKVAAQAGLSVMVIERMGAGGQVMTVEHVANFPAYPEGISGYDLGPLLQEAAEDAGAAFMLDEVESLQASDAGYTLSCTSETVWARAVILACGSRRRALGVPGETELAGKGVSHCASCDGPLFQGDAVLVVGGGDSGLSEALVLSRFASEVLVVFREKQPIAQAYLVDAVTQQANIKLLASTELTEITGDAAGVTGVVLRGDNGLTSVRVRGVFPYAGLQADTGFLGSMLNLNAQGQIETDDQLRTSLPGVFAAGDVRSGTNWRLSSVAEDGETAVRSALAYLRAASPS